MKAHGLTMKFSVIIVAIVIVIIVVVVIVVVVSSYFFNFPVINIILEHTTYILSSYYSLAHAPPCQHRSGVMFDNYDSLRTSRHFILSQRLAIGLRRQNSSTRRHSAATIVPFGLGQYDLLLPLVSTHNESVIPEIPKGEQR